MGPMTPKSREGARFVLTFIDDYSRFASVYLLKAKSEVITRFMEYKALVEKQTGAKVRCVRTDNGGEYTSKQFASFCAKNGIVHRTSAPYTPHQNGLAMNRTLAEMARSMLHHRQIDRELCGEAICIAAHIVNRLPNTGRSSTALYEVFTGVKPDLS